MKPESNNLIVEFKDGTTMYIDNVKSDYEVIDNTLIIRSWHAENCEYRYTYINFQEVKYVIDAGFKLDYVTVAGGK